MDPLQPRLTLTVDDEHPWFEHIMANQRALRNINGVPGVVKPPAPLELTVRLPDCAEQRYSLEHVAELQWSNAKAKLRTNWTPHGAPVTVEPADQDTTTTTERKPAK